MTLLLFSKILFYSLLFEKEIIVKSFFNFIKTKCKLSLWISILSIKMFVDLILLKKSECRFCCLRYYIAQKISVKDFLSKC